MLTCYDLGEIFFLAPGTSLNESRLFRDFVGEFEFGGRVVVGVVGVVGVSVRVRGVHSGAR
jgi:hypothetical protein